MRSGRIKLSRVARKLARNGPKVRVVGLAEAARNVGSSYPITKRWNPIQSPARYTKRGRERKSQAWPRTIRSAGM